MYSVRYRYSFPPLLTVNCVSTDSLRISEEKLKETLEESNRAALTREKELLAEIDKLQQLLQEKVSTTTISLVCVFGSSL
jgi:hypothetical protein